MMKRIVSVLLIFLISTLTSYSQVAINTDGSTPDNSAMLDVKSTTKGIQIPKMTELQIKYIDNPANGLLVFNSDQNRYYFFDDSSGEWKEIAVILWTCGDALLDSRNSKSYATIQIGTQCWMAENLNYETTNSWWYDNNSENGNVYGRLYTWEAALTACPSGWSLPSDEEWKQMEMALGMSQSEADNSGWRGTDEGEKMKSTSGWNNNGNGTNSSGFNALPGGFCWMGGSFDYLGDNGSWWSSSEISEPISLDRGLSHDYDQVFRSIWADQRDGLSVRCLKD